MFNSSANYYLYHYVVIDFDPPQARIQALHISKKFYTKPELASKIEVCAQKLIYHIAGIFRW